MTLAPFCRGGLLALAGFTLAAHAALPDPVLRSVREAGIAPESVALWVAPVTGGEPLAQHNAEQPMNPASVMKLLLGRGALRAAPCRNSTRWACPPRCADRCWQRPT